MAKRKIPNNTQTQHSDKQTDKKRVHSIKFLGRSGYKNLEDHNNVTGMGNRFTEQSGYALIVHARENIGERGAKN